MPVYTPVTILEPVKATECSLEAFRWRKGRLLSADLYFGKEKFLRVSFSKVAIFRLVDGVSISKEEWQPTSGIIPEHLLYSVTGAHYWDANSDLIASFNEALVHYRVVTVEHCLDVLAETPPRASVLSVVKN